MSWQIVIIGPIDETYLIAVDGIGEYVYSEHGNLYPCSELERCAPFFTGARVFHNHGRGRVSTHLVQHGWDGIPGRIARSWWDAKHREIRGTFEAGETWERRLRAARQAGRLDEYGFSVDMEAVGRHRQSRHTGENLFIIERIRGIRSVDLAQAPWVAACGGRFL